MPEEKINGVSGSAFLDDYSDVYIGTTVYSEDGSVKYVPDDVTEMVDLSGSSYGNLFVGTPYENEYRILTDWRNQAIENAKLTYTEDPVQLNVALSAIESQYYTNLQSLATSIRERDQASLKSQIAQIKAAGRNPALEGLDLSSASSAGSGVSLSGASMPEAMTQAQRQLYDADLRTQEIQQDSGILGMVGSVASLFLNGGLSIASLVQNGIQVASNVALQEARTDAEELVNLQMLRGHVEQYVYDNAPSYDPDSEIKPSWSLGAGVPDIPSQYASQAVDFARQYYDSPRFDYDRQRGSYDRASVNNALAQIRGNGYYNDNMTAMTNAYADVAQMKIELEKLYYNKQTELENYMLKYYRILSPQIAADAVNTYNLHQVEFYSSLDSSLSAEALNLANSYQSELYRNLDPKLKAEYDNFVIGLHQRQADYFKLMSDSENAVMWKVEEGLKSDSPSVRAHWARVAQRKHRRSNRREKFTAWQQFMQVAQPVVGAALTIGGTAAAAAGAPALGAGVASAGQSMLHDSNPYDTGGFSGLSGLSGF